VLRIRDHKDHHVNLAISPLERDSAFERLDVPEPHFQLATSRSSDQDRNAVPRTAIAWDRQWHLCSPDRAAGKSPPEPFSEPQLGGIPGGITVGVHLERDAQADRCSRAGSLIDSEFPELSALDPAEMGVGHVGGSTGGALADRRVEAAREEFRAECRPDALGDPTPVQGGFVPRRHAGHPASLDLRGSYLSLLATQWTAVSSSGTNCVPLDGEASA
jgi:hypothetical protein